jgi:ATP-dependent DNA ligase
MQEKMDGVRMILTRKGDSITAISRTGREATIPQEVHDTLIKTSVQNYIIDGELVGDVYHVFDLLRLQAMDFAAKNTFEERYEALVELLNGIDDTNVKVVKTHSGYDKTQAFEDLKSAEGVVFKHRNAFYKAGRPSSGGGYLKYKFYKSCSAIVTAINDKRSVSLGLIEDLPEHGSEYVVGRRLISVGNCTIPVNYDFPQNGDIVEIKYLYARKPSNALYQPSYLGKRTDIQLKDVLLSQLIYKVGEEEE